MATVLARTRGGLPKPNYVGTPFDSDDVVPATSSAHSRSRVSKPSTSSSGSSAPQSSGHSNPFDSEATSGRRGHANSHFASKHRSGTAEAKRGKSKQQYRELFGAPEIVQGSSQNSHFAQSEEARFADQSVEQLEQFALNKSQDTTRSIKNAIRIAEDTKGVATKTLESLHDQGQQIRRTHDTAVRLEEELGRGEKLLGSMGGIFSMTWKPKKGHKISGPQVDPEQYKRSNNSGERSALGLTGAHTRPRTNLSGSSSTQVQLQMEMNTQDDDLSDLSNALDSIRGMAVEMGHEIGRQSGDLDRLHDDVDELNARVGGANNRTRHLLRR